VNDLSEIPAIILCGGRGTRIRDVADDVPKPMILIGGKPVVWHIMKIYAAAGCTKFILCLGYKGYVLKEYFLNFTLHERDVTIRPGSHGGFTAHGSGSENEWEITLVETGLDTQTGSRIKRALKYVKTDVFMMSYGDSLGNVNVGDLFRFHRTHPGCATLTAVRRPPSRFGEIETCGDKVVNFTEKMVLGQECCINGGYMVMDRSVERYITDDTNSVLEIDVLPRCAEDGQLYVFRHEGFRHPMDTFKDWEYLTELWEQGNAPWKIW
jgi:glucose-1-phosphate cytidylyltransferase